MGSPRVAMIHDLGQKFLLGFKEQQKSVIHDFEELKKIVVTDSHTPADLPHSNAHASQQKRDEVFVAMLHREEKHYAIIKQTLKNFIQQQREYLLLEKEMTTSELKNKELREKSQEELDNAYKKQIKLNEEYIRIQAEIKKYMEQLQETIDKIKNNILRDHQIFNLNFEKNIRELLQKTFATDEDSFTISIRNKQVRLSINDIVNIFLEISNKAFAAISKNEAVDLNELKAHARDEITELILDRCRHAGITAEASDHDIQDTTNSLMGLFETQEESLREKLVIQKEKQELVTLSEEAMECTGSVKDQVDSIHEEASAEDVDAAFVDDSLECFEECEKVIKPVSILHVERGEGYMDAVKTHMLDAKEEPMKPDPTVEVSTEMKHGL